jgi:2'-5' RNA ligase
MNELGFPPDKRGFSPHLTVARVRLPGHADYQSALRRVNDRSAGACTIDTVTLFSSRLDPAGAVYTVQHETLLSGVTYATLGS